MNLDIEAIKKIAHLARLDFNEDDAEHMLKDMNEILTWIEKLKELDTTGVKPITNMSFEVNALREDKVKDQLDHERALKNAPKRDEDYFRVPKVLE